jgi:hypothetical protein
MVSSYIFTNLLLILMRYTVEYKKKLHLNTLTATPLVSPLSKGRKMGDTLARIPSL